MRFNIIYGTRDEPSQYIEVMYRLVYYHGAAFFILSAFPIALSIITIGLTIRKDELCGFHLTETAFAYPLFYKL